MTNSRIISQVVFNRSVTTTCILAQVAAAAVLLAGIGDAHAKNGGGRSPIDNGGAGLRQD